jgi:CRP-like cAMP-binding protein
MFGEAAVLTHSPRFATVTALMETTVAVVDKSYLEEEMHRSSLMSLAIQAVAASFVDLNSQTTALLMERNFTSALDVCLRELALKGQQGEGGSRFVPWNSLLERLVQKTKIGESDISDRVARQPGFRIDTQSDRLILLQDP